jgi:putative transposase
MPRARRHFIPGYVWHITHRCHKKEFLLKFVKDRHRWMHWLFEAKKRYGLVILNYMVTSNHIHLLVYDNDKPRTISNSMQLIAGRTGQEYNIRKFRKGAFWEDRYHATAIDRDDHLFRCMVYIDMNMVRAGVVSHPAQWECCGYNEIQNPRQRYSLINFRQLMGFLNISSIDQLKMAHQGWVEEMLKAEMQPRERRWSRSIAVGNKAFVDGFKNILRHLVKGRNVIESDQDYQLREHQIPYGGDMDRENDTLSHKNTYFWNGSLLN